MMTANEIRQTFLDFFRQKQHQIVPSAPIVVKNDPTLLFTNAGMNQFKDIFLGNKKPAYQRVADMQKCLRVSGKHNDLEEVGQDTYHHTMFEMLGNWSFGIPDNSSSSNGYFKEEAIAWAWELLTEVYKIPKDQLYVTVFGGDENDRLPRDEESYGHWEKHISEDHILFGSKKDNFWEMGASGPCGPCSEIHVDCRPETDRRTIDGKTLINTGDPQVIEIWNLVFIEFNRLKDNSLKHLPARHVDTGMGLERLVRVLQNKDSNYDTDLFTPLIRETEKLSNKKYAGSADPEDVAFRVIADHIRAISFTIADGQLPSNTGAGYVVRRILRRAVRYYFSFLDIKQPLLYKLTDVLAIQFENVFPELIQQREFVKKVIHEEENGFLRTLESGIKRMEEYFSNPTAQKEVNGKMAFELYDTFGFPLDLTLLIAKEKGYTVDEAGFKKEMQQQKNRSRKATAIDTGDWITINLVPKSSFAGYHDLLVETRVVKYRKIKAKKKEQYQVVLEETPFYAESGGQVGDTGMLKIGETVIPVIDTKKENDLIIHFTNKIAEDMDAPVVAKVDMEKRLRTMYNHTATHLLHAALKEVLGAHVNQKGSLVSPDLLRFDVSHFTKISDDELKDVEFLVNQKIRENIPVIIKEMPKEEALQLGAIALFGEKYGDIVRVVTVPAHRNAANQPGEGENPSFSIELCGGTHVGHTGMIGLFAITSESAISAGVRRIEALTGPAAIRYMEEKIDQNKTVSALLKTKDPIAAIEKLLQDKTALEKRLEALETKELVNTAKSIAAKVENINDIQFLGEQVHADSADQLKKIGFELKKYLQNYFIVLAANVSGKANVFILIDEGLADKSDLDAAKIIKQSVAPLIKGGGGGQKTLASAGGKDVSKLQEVIEIMKKEIGNRNL